YLLERYLNEEATEKEITRLFATLKKMDTERWEGIVLSFIEEQRTDTDYNPARWEPIIKDILNSEHSASSFDEENNKTAGRKRRFRTSRVAVAAMIAVLLGIGAWFGGQYYTQKTAVATAE